MPNIQIKIKNLATELESFPVDQSIVLEFSEAVEDSYLHSYIHLVQALDSGSLIHIGDTYNQNVGLIREDFKPIDIDIKIVSTNPFQISVKAIKPLTPGHSYQLLIQDSLPIEHLQAIKAISYSDSNITIVNVLESQIGTHTIEIVKDSEFIGNKHLVTLKVDDEIQTFDINKNNIIKISKLTLKLEGMVFIEGESFIVDIQDFSTKLIASFVVNFQASSTKDVLAISSNYTILKPEDIYNYNNTVNPVLDYSTVNYTVEATGINSFIVTFNTDLTDKLDLNNITYKVREAFNMYTLSSLELYDSSKIYEVETSIISSNQIEFFIREVI